MGLFNKNNGGFMDVIRCEEPDYLIWKWHPEGSVAGNNTKENSIRWGSSLRVKDGSVAVFVHNVKGQLYQDYIEGPFDQKISTANFPILTSIIGLAFDGNSPFQAEIYFINLAKIVQIKFAVPFFDMYDPRFLDFGVPVAVRGTINFNITDYKEFISLHRLETFTLDTFEKQIKDSVVRYTKDVVANAPENNSIPVVQLERKINQINELVEADIKSRFYKDFGVNVTGLDIGAIEIDKGSDGYQQLKAVTQDLTTATMQAQTEVNIKEMRDAQKLSVFERAGRMFTDIKEDAYARHKQTQTANMAAYQTEAAEHVGVAGAAGLGAMGAGGAANVGGGMNPAGMMAGMVLGSTIGQNIAGQMNKVMNGANSQQNPDAMTPPPIAPNVMYNVAVNGQPTGPFDLSTLGQMIMAGQLLKESLVWTQGMSTWERADSINDINKLFPEMPPIPNGNDGNEMPPIPE